MGEIKYYVEENSQIAVQLKHALIDAVNTIPYGVLPDEIYAIIGSTTWLNEQKEEYETQNPSNMVFDGIDFNDTKRDVWVQYAPKHDYLMIAINADCFKNEPYESMLFNIRDAITETVTTAKDT